MRPFLFPLGYTTPDLKGKCFMSTVKLFVYRILCDYG